MALSGLDIVGPEADLVEIAPPVAVLRPVEHRRRWVAYQEMHGALPDLQRQVPVTLRRQPEDGQYLGRVPVGRRRGGRVVGQQRTRHVLPKEMLEGANLILDDRIA